MATYTVNVNTTATYSLSTTSWSGTVSFGSPYNSQDIKVTRGDTVKFKWNSHSGPGIERLAVYGLDDPIWTNNSTMYMTSVGQTFTKYIRSDAPYGNNIDIIAANIRADNDTFSSKTIHIDTEEPPPVGQNYTITVNYSEFLGGGTILVGKPQGVDELRAGDSVTFDLGSGINASEFSSTIWTSTSSIGYGGRVTKYVKSSVSGGVTDSIRFYHTSGTTDTTTVTTYSAPDYRPNSFSISNVSNVNPKSDVTSDPVTLSGFNQKLYVYINSGSGYEARGSVQSGQSVSFVAEAPLDYGQSKTVYVRLYRSATTSSTLEYSTSFQVSTKTYPDVDELLVFPVTSGTITLDDVGDFFGRRNSNAYLTDYIKGNYYVPTIAGNEGVPTSAPIKLTDLRGSYTGLYFIYPPTDKSTFNYTASGASTRVIAWDITDQDIVMGYGPVSEDLEYRYVWNVDYVNLNDSNDSGNYQVTGRVGSLGAWSQGNTLLRIEASVPQSSTATYIGYVDIYVRNRVDTHINFYRRVQFRMQFYA